MRVGILIVFVLVVILTLYSIVADNTGMYMLTKPLIMATLGMYYLISLRGQKISSVVLMAISFSLVGDVLLMFSHLFLFGLLAFLVAHVAYIFVYRKHRNSSTADPLQGVYTTRLAFPVVLAGMGLLVVLFPKLGELKLPVTLYAFVLTFMVLNALFRFGRTSTSSFWLVLSGAILFMISDGILAFNKFHTEISSADLMIMSTYIVGQFLIIEGLIRHQSK